MVPAPHAMRSLLGLKLFGSQLLPIDQTRGDLVKSSPGVVAGATSPLAM
jgi:hypothetical protein